VISLDDFLKTHALVISGGHAKLLIQSGGVMVNGEVETRRRRKLQLGDAVELLDQRIVVQDSDLTR
jgi:ribosome-associated protein